MARFFNTGKCDDEMVRPNGYDAGTAIVDFSAYGFRKVVAAGEHVYVPDAIPLAEVMKQSPSLKIDVAEETPAASEQAPALPALDAIEPAAKSEATAVESDKPAAKE